VLIGVELIDEAILLPSFRHPLNAAYVFGPERSALSPAMVAPRPVRAGGPTEPLRPHVSGNPITRWRPRISG
jgi:hypothetical protein